jgi:hypothetical protein
VNGAPNHNPGWLGYYLNGSVVGLGHPAGYITNRHVITSDTCFVFEDGMWRAKIGARTPPVGSRMSSQRAKFLAAEWYNKSGKGADQQSVLTVMYSFMLIRFLGQSMRPTFPHPQRRPSERS